MTAMSGRPGFSLLAELKNGKLAFDRGRMARLLARLEDGRYDITIEKETKNRSRKLEKYLWGHVYQALSDHTGYTKDELHAYCKGRFLTQQTTRIVLADEHGEVKDDATIQIVPTTTVLDWNAYKAFIWDVRQMAAELGCVTEDPDPEWMFNKKDEAA